ncbi:PEP-CTERM sorting domain-containing protein [uncultured Azohydromonas sp.]|jgi:PEP-CTERM putative exosortase interaction domain/probable extracellular repeat, HAF family|uniref:PEP-CTERM sorting domain-containing protein n=1 Tax=uncultured Azohydromonas sp. TaxID=487342 RepID=UPI002635DD74|nr:PEP-CTERM sorting domain-containing protein [uncultured Azohydromonas sp.]
MRHSVILGVSTLLVALVWPPAQAETRYRIHNLGVLQADDSASLARGINNDGWVVGYTQNSSGAAYTAFLYNHGQMKSLGLLDGARGEMAYDVNDRGQVVGNVFNPVTRARYPFLYESGHIVNPVAGLGGVQGGAYAINEQGQLTGSIDSRAFFHDGTQSRFIPLGDTTSSAGVSVNDHGIVLGYAQYSNDYYAFTYDGTTVTRLETLPGGGNGFEPFAINNSNQIIGQDFFEGVGYKAYLRNGAAVTELGSLGGGDTGAYGLNDRGVVVGASRTSTGEFHAYVYQDGVLNDLNDLLLPGAAKRWELSDAFDINDRGQIVGSGTINGVRRAYIATPVPEPGTWALLLVGLGGIVMRYRCRTNT